MNRVLQFRPLVGLLCVFWKWVGFPLLMLLAANMLAGAAFYHYESFMRHPSHAWLIPRFVICGLFAIIALLAIPLMWHDSRRDRASRATHCAGRIRWK
jgi:hypothetical protein